LNDFLIDLPPGPRHDVALQKEGAMTHLVHRRGFLGRVLGASAALGFSRTPSAFAQQGNPDAWLTTVKGQHRSLFDFPQHRNGVPLLHILNYLNTYAEAYKGAGQAAAVGTFYGVGPQSSIALAFNDAAWSKYALGEYLSLKDGAGRPYSRNVFHRPTAADAHLVGQAMQLPPLEAAGGVMPAIGIENLQKMGTTFLMCANAFGLWCLELEARGKGKAADLDRDLRANLLPGVVIVPAMVIAIEKAQGAGISYNRQ
jgi:hypothetical protein